MFKNKSSTMLKKEDVLQITVADYLRLQYPKALFCHIANERQTSPKRGAKLKRMGVTPGMPDVMIYETSTTYRGLAIELKIKPNKPTKNQLGILEKLEIRGWKAIVCYSFEQAKEIIDKYFKYWIL